MFSDRFPIDWRVCPDCSGLGIRPGYGFTCDTCGGSGGVLDDDIRKYIFMTGIRSLTGENPVSTGTRTKEN